MLRKSAETDDIVLSQYLEREGREKIFLAVTTKPIHWRIVWKAYAAGHAEHVGWKVIEVVLEEDSPEFAYRFSFRSSELSRTLSKYTFFELGELNQVSRDALGFLGLEQRQPIPRDNDNRFGNCISFVVHMIRDDLVNDAHSVRTWLIFM